MQEYLIKEYIKKLTVDDVKNFASLKNINISDSEAIILYNYAKKYYLDILNGKDDFIIKELKEKLSSNTFKEAYKLYLEYKIKYLK